jgi:hypothetical protein
MSRNPAGLTALVLASAILAAAPATAVTINPSFESGDTSGWTGSGDTGVVDASFGITPTDGSFQALLTTGVGAVSASTFESSMGLASGLLDSLIPLIEPNTDGSIVTEASGLQQTFTATAGSTVIFDYTFLTNEGSPEKLTSDFLFYDLSGVGSDVLTSARRRNGLSTGTSFTYQSATQQVELVIPVAGTYTLTIGVADLEDTLGDTGSIFDNFILVKAPEPNSFLLVAGGLIGLHAYARQNRRLARR